MAEEIYDFREHGLIIEVCEDLWSRNWRLDFFNRSNFNPIGFNFRKKSSTNMKTNIFCTYNTKLPSFKYFQETFSNMFWEIASTNLAVLFYWLPTWKFLVASYSVPLPLCLKLSNFFLFFILFFHVICSFRMANRPKGYGLSRELAEKVAAKYSNDDEQEIVAWLCDITQESVQTLEACL